MSIKIDYDSIKKKLQPAIEKASVEHVQKLADKQLFTSEEKRQLTTKIVSEDVQITEPQELLDRLKKEVGKM